MFFRLVFVAGAGIRELTPSEETLNFKSAFGQLITRY